MNKGNAYIITGPERSGSRFIAKVVSYVVGLNEEYNWPGYDLKGTIGDSKICLHRSQPFKNLNQFSPLRQFENEFAGYNLNFILTTRDMSIVKYSKFLHDPTLSHQKLSHDQKTSRQIISDIIQSRHRSFIWNYETMIYLGDVYFRQLYSFLDSDSEFIPPDLVDGNAKYLIQ